MRAVPLLLSLGLLCQGVNAEALPKPKDIVPPTIEQVDEAIHAGIEFLIEHQNPNGSWGSATKTKGLNVYAPVPGSHHAFRSAVTGLAIMGLCRNAEQHPEALPAIEKASNWLVQELPDLRRADATTTYNVWGHAYGIRALVALADLQADQADKVSAYKKLAQSQVDLLIRQQEINGGWGYLDFDMTTRQPSGLPTSFTTATVLIALHEASERFDITLKSAPIQKSIRQILRQRTPDGAFVYSESHRWWPRYRINRPAGSLARSQVCHVALSYFGEQKYAPQELIDSWLDRMWARIGWLDIARKRPVPHESWAANSGYFFFYGTHYAAMAIQRLEDKERQKHHSGHLTRILVDLQEKNGCWWDYPLYNYHYAYGTGYALTALADVREMMK